MSAHPTETVSKIQDGQMSKIMIKSVGISKREKSREGNQLETRNDNDIRKVYDASTQPVSRGRSNLSVIMRNKKAGKNVNDARIMPYSKEAPTNLEAELDEADEEREPQENFLAKAFLGLGSFVGEGAVAGCKKVAELSVVCKLLTKGSNNK
jgi:hypothetical protein